MQESIRRIIIDTLNASEKKVEMDYFIKLIFNPTSHPIELLKRNDN